jgi:putative hydrolase of HD superfamily
MKREEPDATRLQKQFAFIHEIDKLKKILRQTLLTDGSRRENDAEHSWHISAMALILSEYSNSDIDVLRVLKMLLIHDLVEIGAGDTFCYDVEANKGKAERERLAAEEVFGLLPSDQCRDLIELWEEFERRETPESKFAAALDRLQPVLHNCATEGAAWQKHGVKRPIVEAQNSHIKEGSRVLWEEFSRIIDDAAKKGYLPES